MVLDGAEHLVLTIYVVHVMWLISYVSTGG